MTDDPITIYDLQRSGAIRRVPDGFWHDPSNARAVLEELWRREGITAETAPMLCRWGWLRQHLSTLQRIHRGSPSLLLMTLYPGRYRPADFPEMPKADDIQEAAFVAEGLEWSEKRGRRWQQAQRVRSEHLGRCLMCLADREPNSQHCARHAEHLRRYGRDKYTEMRRLGVCYRCRHEPPYKAGACRKCWAKLLVVKARRGRKLYRAQKAAGLCGYKHCKNTPEAGHVYCAEHRNQNRARYYRLDYAAKAREYKARKRAKE